MEKKLILLMVFAIVSSNAFSYNKPYFEGIPPNELFPEEEILVYKSSPAYNLDEGKLSDVYTIIEAKPPVFDIDLKFDIGTRLMFDVYPGSTTSLNEYANNSGVMGFGGKIEVFMGDFAEYNYGSNGFIGFGVGIKGQSNEVNFDSQSKKITTISVPLYTTARYSYKINDYFNPFVKGNIGFAVSNQSGENYSKYKFGFYGGAYLGVDIGIFSIEAGIERTGASKSFSAGVGCIFKN